MQNHIHLSIVVVFFPKAGNTKKNICGYYRKMFSTREISKLKKRQDKSNLLLCCPTFLHEITTVMKDEVVMHAAK